ncbi:aldehyde dehydrogenase (NADP(+)), partial [Sphingomonas sp. SFZ2018-12]|nr:aldehyde dehydrogenase (NADP(+)) [Sphingomonas sp. SFZ2018-12]
MTEAVQLTGAMFIGGVSRWSETRFAAWDPASGVAIEDVSFSVASLADVADACACADAALLPYLARSLE